MYTCGFAWAAQAQERAVALEAMGDGIDPRAGKPRATGKDLGGVGGEGAKGGEIEKTEVDDGQDEHPLAVEVLAAERLKE